LELTISVYIRTRTALVQVIFSDAHAEGSHSTLARYTAVPVQVNVTEQGVPKIARPIEKAFNELEGSKP
jgi:hypothetical protein